MAPASRGLGKGLGALLQDMTQPPQSEQDIKNIAVNDIVPNPYQPRQSFSEESLQELADSIRSQGVLQPVLVREGKTAGQYELIAGERRLRAAKMAQLPEIPALVREISDEDSVAIALIENLQREDLNPIEEAAALKSLKDSYNLSQEDLAIKVGRSRSAVANALRLLQLPDPIQDSLKEGKLSSGHARAILSVQDESAQMDLFSFITNHLLNVRQVEAMANQWKETGSFSGEMSESAPAAPSKRKQGAPSPLALSLEEKFKERFNCKIKVKGSEDKGSITFTYAGSDQLKDLLDTLQITLD